MSSLKKNHQEFTKKNYSNQNWLLKNEFKLWLREVPSDNTKCKYIACNTILVSGKSEIVKHSVGIKHKLNVKSIQGTKPAFSLSNVKEVETFQNNVKVAEIKLASFFGEHNIAFQTVDHLTPVLQDIFPDSKICKAISLHRTKLTSIIKNVVAPVEINNTIDILKTNPFSVLVDESTDLTCSKFLCLLVRFGTPIFYRNYFTGTDILRNVNVGKFYF